jgi:argininosuccinate synthase
LGRNGIGQIDVVENRFVGMKAAVCTSAGMTIFYTAHRVIEQLTMDRDLMHPRSAFAGRR